MALEFVVRSQSFFATVYCLLSTFYFLIELRPPIGHTAGEPAKAGTGDGPNDTGRQRPEEKPKTCENGSQLPGVAMPDLGSRRKPIQHRGRRDTYLEPDDWARDPGRTK